MKLSLAHSPCPNDTFMFYALATGKISSFQHGCSFHQHDVETLNRLAQTGVYDISKLSFAAYIKLRNTYRMLNTGAALGYGCGPLLVAKPGWDSSRIDEARIVVPGELTTAHLLFSLYAPRAGNKTFVSYEQILPWLLGGKADCGVIIHESRFVFAQAGLQSLVDLGAWWEQRTGLPIPLGCIAVRTDLDEGLASDFDQALYQSITYAQTHREQASAYAGLYAKELDKAVIAKHIEMFVNSFSLDLGPLGRRAVERLEQEALEARLLS